MAYDNWQELQAYLGDEFTLNLVPGNKRIKDDVIARKGADYYRRQARERLYVETARALDYLREPFFQYVCEAAPRCEVLDYECGIGSDGLRLATMGYTPVFADEPGVCVDYLKWRLKRRGLKAQIHTLKDAPRLPLGVWCGPPEEVPALDRLAELGEMVALGVGPLGWDLLEAYNERTRAQITNAYGLLRWQPFNVNWLFIAFETPEPIRAQEEVADG